MNHLEGEHPILHVLEQGVVFFHNQVGSLLLFLLFVLNILLIFVFFDRVDYIWFISSENWLDYFSSTFFSPFGFFFFSEHTKDIFFCLIFLFFFRARYVGYLGLLLLLLIKGYHF